MSLLPYPHTGIDISEELFSIINKWNLNDKVYIIVTNNGANVVREIELLKDNYLVELYSPISKNIQAFFCLPKQAQWLQEMQIKHITEFQGIDNNN
ncbi:16736_t:CDS:2, partial [Gigaspora rosea]